MGVRDINPADFALLDRPEDRIKFILRYAILAPSTHNTQPWLFKVDSTQCEIFYDEKYSLHEADPKKRDLFISMGCLLENLTIAAKYFGVFGSLKIDVNPSSSRVAIFAISSNTVHSVDRQYERLLNAIPRRINARGFFNDLDTRDFSTIEKIISSVPTEYLERISVKLVYDKAKINKIADLTADGLIQVYHQPAFRREMSGWLKNSMTRAKEGLPGYALRVPFLLSFILPIIVRYKDIGSKLARLNQKSLASAPLLTVILSKESIPRTWVDVGRAAQRMMLDLNDRKLNTSIFVASIEVGELYKELKKILGVDEEPQFLFIIGKVDKLHKPTPRHSLVQKLI